MPEQTGSHILITGASGFIGRRLAISVARDGLKVRALVRQCGPHRQALTPGPSPRGRGELPSPPSPLPGGEGSMPSPPAALPEGEGGAVAWEWAVGDLLDPATLVAACEGVETVFHCAGIAEASGGVDQALLWRVNVEGTRNLLEAAGRAGVRRFVFLSSVKAMAEPGEACADEDWPGEPASPYGRAKRAAENLVLEAGARFGMHVVNLRLALVYGEGNRGNLWKLAQLIRRLPFLHLPDVANRRSLVHVEDVVAAMRLVAERPEANGRTYIVADPRRYSTREIENAIRAALALAGVPGLTMPAWVLRAAGRLHPRLDEMVDRLLGSACYSPARIEQELGWRARVGLTEGMREMLGGEARQSG